MTVTIDGSGYGSDDMGYVWAISIGGIYWRLLSVDQMTPEDARLMLINSFQKMGVKNGYGFGSPSPVLVWSEDF